MPAYISAGIPACVRIPVSARAVAASRSASMVALDAANGNKLSGGGNGGSSVESAPESTSGVAGACCIRMETSDPGGGVGFRVLANACANAAMNFGGRRTVGEKSVRSQDVGRS